MVRALPILALALVLAGALAFLVIAPDEPGRLDTPPQSLGKPEAFAHDVEAARAACAAAWRGAGFDGEVRPQGGGPLPERHFTYGCVAPSGSEPLFLAARYAGGQRTDPASWRVDVICDADGNALTPGGGRTPELCDDSPIRKAPAAPINR